MAIGDAVKSRGFVEYGRYCTLLIFDTKSNTECVLPCIVHSRQWCVMPCCATLCCAVLHAKLTCSFQSTTFCSCAVLQLILCFAEMSLLCCAVLCCQELLYKEPSCEELRFKLCVLHCRQPMPYRPVENRMQDYNEVLGRLPQQDQEELLHTQAARCMDCGTPFCHQTASGESQAAFQLAAACCGSLTCQSVPYHTISYLVIQYSNGASSFSTNCAATRLPGMYSPLVTTHLPANQILEPCWQRG